MGCVKSKPVPAHEAGRPAAAPTSVEWGGGAVPQHGPVDTPQPGAGTLSGLCSISEEYRGVPNISGQPHASTADAKFGRQVPSSPDSTGPNDGVMRVVALLQDLLSTSNDRHKAQLGHAMALLITKLPVAWASLTVIAPSGQSYQIVAQAYDPCTHGCTSLTRGASLGVSDAARMARATASIAGSSKATPSRQSSSSSITPSMVMTLPLEQGLGDIQDLHGSNSSIEVMVRSGGQPVTANLCQNCFTSAAAFEQALAALPSDWVPLCRDRGMRSLTCLPLLASNGGGSCVGALSLGSLELLDWGSQWWSSSAQLLTGWAAGALTQTRSAQRAAFFEALANAPDINTLAAAFVLALPALLQDELMPKVESRLALVSSKLSQAVVYAAPMEPEGGRTRSGNAGPGGLSGALHMCSATSVLVVGQPYEHTSTLSMEGLVLKGPSDSQEHLDAGIVIGAPTSMRDPPSFQTIRSIRGVCGGGGGGRCSNPVQYTGPASDSGLGSTSNISQGLTFPVLQHPLQAAAAAAAAHKPRSASSSGPLPAALLGAGRRASGCGGSSGTKLHPLALPQLTSTRIATDSTLLMSVLEAGDIMTIKDALAYFGRDRMVARDLALPGRPVSSGTLVLLPLIHKCRAMGCVYVFARSDVNAALPRNVWTDMLDMMSRAVFTKLVGALRAEWYQVLSDEETAPAPVAQPSNGSAVAVEAAQRILGWATSAALHAGIRDMSQGSIGARLSGGMRLSAETNSSRAGSARGMAGALQQTGSMGHQYSHIRPISDGSTVDTQDGAVALAPVAMAHLATTCSSWVRTDSNAAQLQGSDTAPTSGQPSGVAVQPVFNASAGTIAAALDARWSQASTTSVPSTGVPVTHLRFGGLEPGTGDLESSCAGGSRPSGGTVSTSTGTFTPAPCSPCGGPQVVSLTATAGTVAPGPSSAPAAPGAQPSSGGGMAVTEGGNCIGPAFSALAALDEVQSANSSHTGGVPTLHCSSPGRMPQHVQELQGWPELLDITGDIRKTRHMTLYSATYKGQQVAVKVMRHAGSSVDGRSQVDPEQHCTLLMRLTTISHPNLVNVLMVYPSVYEVVVPGARITDHQVHGHGNHHLFLTGVQPRREKYKRGVAVVMEYVPSISLREALTRRMVMVPASNAGAAGACASFGNTGLGANLGLGATGSNRPNSGVLGGGPATATSTAMNTCESLTDPQLSQSSELANSGTVGLAAKSGNEPMSVLRPGSTGAISLLRPGSTGAMAVAALGGNGGSGTNTLGAQPPHIGSVVVGSGQTGSAGGGVATAGNALTLDLLPNMVLLRNILLQVAAGVQQLHAAGLIHGELRPENILVCRSAMARFPTAAAASLPAPSPESGLSATYTAPSTSASPLSPSASPPTSAGPQATAPTPSFLPLIKPAAIAACRASFQMKPGSGGTQTTGSPRPGSDISGAADAAAVVASAQAGQIAIPHTPAPPSAQSLKLLGLASDEPLAEDVCVKLKDSGMCTITISKGQLLVRKLMARPRTGLVPFLAPEIFRGERPTKACDAYSFGLLMWELYTGVPAFSNFSSTPTKLVQTVISDGLRPQFPESTPAWYSSLAARCWHPNAKLRPSFRKIVAALLEAGTRVGGVRTAQPPPVPPPLAQLLQLPSIISTSPHTSADAAQQQQHAAHPQLVQLQVGGRSASVTGGRPGPGTAPAALQHTPANPGDP